MNVGYFSNIEALVNGILRSKLLFGLKKFELESIRAENRSAMRLLDKLFGPLDKLIKELEIEITDKAVEIQKLNKKIKRLEQKAQE